MSIQLFNDDCFNIFPTIENKSIDLFVLDLPYANFKFGKCTACKWDLPIDLDKMWIEIKRMMKPNAVIVFFCNTKFGYALIDSNPKWFKYDLIWKKSRKVGFLSANKQPLRQHENLYVFDNPENEEYNDLELNRNLELRAYSEKVYNFIGKTKKEIIKDIGQKIDHFFRFKSSQFALPILETYNELIEKYKINEMEGFIEYDILKDSWEDSPPKIHSNYNPQKTEGKPYEIKGHKLANDSIYGSNEVPTHGNKTGDRHPTSILPNIELEEHENVYIFNDKKATYNPQKTKADKIRDWSKTKQTDNESYYRKEGETYKSNFSKNSDDGFRHPTSILPDLGEIKGGYYRGENGKPFKRMPNDPTTSHPTSILPDDLESTILQYNNPHKTIHRTQKPEKLLEWLIKTYSNEEDMVMDFCMGSGTAGVACKNLNRKFIGVEMDEEIFKLAKKRIDDTEEEEIEII